MREMVYVVRNSTSRLTQTCSSLLRNIVTRLIISGDAANWVGVGYDRKRVYPFDATCFAYKSFSYTHLLFASDSSILSLSLLSVSSALPHLLSRLGGLAGLLSIAVLLACSGLGEFVLRGGRYCF